MAEEGSNRSLGMGIAAGAAVLVLVAAGFMINKYVLNSIPFHTSDAASSREAAQKKELRVVLIENPASPGALKFQHNVLDDSRVMGMAKSLVWQRDNAQAGPKGSKNRSSDYIGVPVGKKQDLPFLLLYNSKGQVVDGLLGCADMTADQFLAMIARAKKDPRSIAERQKQSGDDDDDD